MQMKQMEQTGLVAALLSAATFGCSGTLASSLLGAGWSPAAAVSIRLLIATAVLTVPALAVLRRHPGALRSSFRSIAGYGLVPVAGCQLCYFEAIQHLSVAVALLMEYSGALLVVGYLWLRRGQAPGRLTVAGSAAAIGGLVLVLDLVGDHHLDPIGLLWGLAAAVGLAAYFLMSADADQPLPPLVFAWGGLGVGALAMLAVGVTGILPFTADRAPVTLAHSHVTWLVPALVLGVVAAAAAYVLGITAARLIGAKMASFLGLAEVLFAGGYAWVLLGQHSRSPEG
jgi:drug/metabolite transporter (DMT)-like permease